MESSISLLDYSSASSSYITIAGTTQFDFIVHYNLPKQMKYIET